mmetsp:Transcript_61388/g.163271  ORF Transcript_61388/g.163271 Transcript_61388/m.163271 type:complete len:640 (-) Transcript_61388:5-1924(-)
MMAVQRDRGSYAPILQRRPETKGFADIVKLTKPEHGDRRQDSDTNLRGIRGHGQACAETAQQVQQIPQTQQRQRSTTPLRSSDKDLGPRNPDVRPAPRARSPLRQSNTSQRQGSPPRPAVSPQRSAVSPPRQAGSRAGASQPRPSPATPPSAVRQISTGRRGSGGGSLEDVGVRSGRLEGQTEKGTEKTRRRRNSLSVPPRSASVVRVGHSNQGSEGAKNPVTSCPQSSENVTPQSSPKSAGATRKLRDPAIPRDFAQLSAFCQHLQQQRREILQSIEDACLRCDIQLVDPGGGRLAPRELLESLADGYAELRLARELALTPQVPPLQMHKKDSAQSLTPQSSKQSLDERFAATQNDGNSDANAMNGCHSHYGHAAKALRSLVSLDDNTGASADVTTNRIKSLSPSTQIELVDLISAVRRSEPLLARVSTTGCQRSSSDEVRGERVAKQTLDEVPRNHGSSSHVAQACVQETHHTPTLPLVAANCPSPVSETESARKPRAVPPHSYQDPGPTDVVASLSAPFATEVPPPSPHEFRENPLRATASGKLQPCSPPEAPRSPPSQGNATLPALGQLCGLIDTKCSDVLELQKRYDSAKSSAERSEIATHLVGACEELRLLREYAGMDSLPSTTNTPRSESWC